MTNNKARKLKRKEGKQRNDADEKRAREKAKEKRQQQARPVKKVRMLSDGSIGLGHNFKIGRTGLYTMIGILSVLTLFSGGMNGWFDQFAPENYGKDKFTPLTYEFCESIDFNDDMCSLDYKFCREYADGESICQYAETNPFVNVDPNESKYTEEEQDFLPPGTSVITDFIFGWFPPDAHAEQRNHFTIGLYKSNSCKALTTTGSDKCPSYESLVEYFDNTNQAMSGEFIWSDYDNDVYRTAPDFKSHYNFYQYANLPTILAVDPDAKWFSCCMDARIVIEPSNFVYYGADLSVDTTGWELEYDDAGNRVWDGQRLVLHKNVYIDGCSFARVAANMTLITQTINYFWNHCEGNPPSLIDYTYIPTIPINYEDFTWYKYTEWINQKAQECRVKC